MNRILIVLLLCIGLISDIAGQAIEFHANTTNSVIAVGDTVEVDITTVNFDGILYFQYTMEWESSVIELISLEDCNSDISLNCTVGTANFNETSPGVLRVSWFDANTQGKSLPNDTLVYRMRFKSLTDGNTNLRFTDSGLEREAEGDNGLFDSSTMVTTTSGTTIVGEGSTGPTGDLSFYVGSASGNLNDEVCVQVTTSGFDSVIYFQYTMEWDSTILELQSVNNCNTTLGLNCNLGQTDFNETSPGVMRVSWLDNATIGIPLNDSTLLYELCFKLIGEGTSAVEITSSGLGLEAETTKAELAATDIIISNGSVNSFSTGNDAGPDALAFKLENISGDVGQEICVPVTTANFDSVVFFQYTMEWDDSILELVRVDNCNTDLGLNCNLGQTNFNETSPGTLRVSWLDAATIGKDLPDDAVLFELCFNLKADGTSNISFTSSGLSIEAETVADGTLPENSITTVNSIATVGNGGNNGGGNDGGVGALTFNAGDLTGEVGQEICVPITTANFDSVIFFQYTMEWDDSILELLRVDNCNTDLGLNCNLGQTNFNETSPGNLRVSWLDPATVGKDLADDAVLFELCFNLKADGTSNISFTSSGLSIEAETAAGGTLPADSITTVNGVATVTTSGGGGNNGGVGSLTFTSADLTGEEGQEICVPITTANFDSVIFFQYTMEWDDSILELLRVDNCNTDLGLNCNLGQTNFNETSPGNLRVSWLDPATVGKDLADDAVLFELCFNLKADGTSNISFTSSGLSIEAETAAGGTLPADSITTVNGVATVTTSGGGGNNGGVGSLTFTSADLTGEEGQEICVPITTANFDSVIFFQYTMEWDDSILELLRVDNCNTDLGLNCNLGQTNFNETSPGNLRVSWLDPATVGKDLADDAVLFELCFNLKTAGTTDISFTGSGLAIEAETAADGALPADSITTVNGVATVTTSGGGGNNGGVGSLTFTSADLTGEEGQEICVPITTANFDSVIFFQYTMEWDDSILELVRVDNCNTDLGLNCNLGQTNFNETTPGNLRVSWLDPATVGKELTDNTVLYELCFNLKTAGTTDISFTGSGLAIEAETAADGALPADSITTVNGAATVTTAGGGGNGGGNNGGVGSLTFTSADLTGEEGQEICVPITTANFDSVIFFQYTMEWDDSILELVRVDNCNTDLGLNCNLGQTNFNETTPGNLRVSWLDPATVGKELTDNTVLYELCFNLKTAGTTDISFTGSGLAIEAETAADGALPADSITTVNGAATVTTAGGGGGNGGGGNNGGVGSLTFTSADLTGEEGQEICVPITTANFDSVIFFQYTMEWDDSILELVRVDNCNTDLGLNCNLGQTNFNETTPGNLRVSWLDPATVGKELTDNTVLYELCFNLKTAGTTDISFTGSGLAIEAETAADGALPADSITTVNGAATVTTVGGGGNGGGGNNGGVGSLTFTSADLTGEEGQEICVPVTTANFDSVIFFQYTMEWDDSILELVRVDNCNTDLGLNCNLGQTNFNETSPGNLRVSWLDPATVGKELTDNTVLYELCFNLKAAGTTDISFTGSGLAIEAETAADGSLPADSITTVNGAATVTTAGGGGGNGGGGNNGDLDPLSFTASNLTGEVGMEICVPVTTSNFDSVLFFQYSIEWDDTILDLVQIDKCNSDLGLNCTLGGANFTETTPGVLNVNWSDASTSGIDLVDNTVLFEICYSLKSTGSTDISFTSTGQDIEAETVSGGMLDANAISTTNGSALVNSSTGGGGGNLEPLSFTASNLTAQVGSELCIPVTTANFDSVIFFQYTMEWDDSILDLVRVDNCNSDLGLNCNLGQTNFNETAPGVLRVSWLDPATVGKDLVNNSVLFELCFDLKAEGTTDITFTGSGLNIEAETAADGSISGNDISTTDGSATVTAAGDGGGGNLEPLSFIAANLTDQVGAERCIPVMTSNFDSILSFQYSMEWDDTLLDLVRIDNCNLDLGLNCNLGQTNFDETTPGILNVIWSDAATVGKSLPNNAVLFELCFDLKASGTSSIAFTGNGLAIEAETVADGVISGNAISTTDGAATITAGNGGGGGNTGVLSFATSDLTGDVGMEICVPVTTANFDSVIFFQYTMEWDDSILELVRIDNCNTDLGLNCNLGQTNFNETSPGNLRVSWLDPATVGKDLADNAVLFELCFNLKSAGTTDISFTGNGLTIEAETAADGAIDETSITTTNGLATVNSTGGGGGGGSGPLTFASYNLTGDVGMEICVPVTTANFDSVIFFQYTMEWDDSILELVRIDNCNTDLGLNCNLGQTNFNETSPGNLRVSWLDPATVGKDLADNSVLFELCFNLKSAGTTDISFTGNGLTIEAETAADGAIDETSITTTNGLATVNSTGGGGSGPLTFASSNLTGDVGMEICVPVTTANFDSVIFFQYTMEWDDSILELVRIDNCNTDLGLNCNLGQTNFNETSPGNLRVSWLDPATVGKDLADNSVLFELCFNLKSAGTTDISFTGNGLIIEAETAADGAIDETSITTTNGLATVNSTGGGGGGGSGPLTFASSNLTGDVGMEICVPVTTANFDSVIFFQYTMEWDDSILELVRIDNCNTDLGLNCNLGQTNFNETSPGNLRVSWLDPATVGKDLADNSVLFELCFNLKSAGTTDISFTGNGLTIEAETAADGAIDETSITTTNGLATVNSAGGGGGGGTAEPLTFSATNLSGEVGMEICIPVTTTNFDSVIFFQYTMEWDDSILELLRIDNCNSDLGLNCTLGQTNFNETSPGNLRVSWLDPATVGKDLVDNTVLFELCFSLKAEGTTNISFTGSGLSIEAETAADGTLIGNEIITTNATAEVAPSSGGGGGNGGNLTPLSFTATNLSGEVGQEICIPVTTVNFDSVVFFQYTMEWDDSILELVRVDNCNTDLGLNCNLGQTNFNETSPGNLRVSWLDPAAVGKDLADNTVLFELCFNLKAAGTTDIAFTGNELAIEAETIAEGAIGSDKITTTNASARVNPLSGGGGGGGNVEPLSFTATSLSGIVGQEICIPVTTANFDDVIFFQYTMEWDDSIIELIRVDNCNTDLGLNCTLGQTNFNETSPGTMRVSWLDPATVGQNLEDNAVLYELCFRLKESGTTNIAFTGNGLAIEAETAADGTIGTNDITTTNGIAIVNPSGGDDTPGELKFTTTSANVETDETTCLNIMVENFDNITSFQFSQTWDASVLELTGVQACNGLLTGLNCNLGNANFSLVGNNRIDITWNDATGNGVTIPDTEPLFQLCFKAIGSPGTGSVIDYGTNVSATNAAGTLENSNISTQNAEVNINGTISAGRLNFIAEGSMGDVGETVCLQITTENFRDIVFFQYTMEWDGNVLELENVQSCNQDLGLNCNLGQTNFNQTSASSMRVSWLDPSTVGATIPDASVLYELCFKIVGQPGDNSLVRFTSSEIALEAENDQGPLMGSDIVTQNGFISVNDDGGSNNAPLVFNIGDGTGRPNDTVCVAITPQNFDEIIHFQYNIEWNSAVLQFIDVMGCNSSLTGLECEVGPQSTNFNLTSPELMRVSWFDPATLGINVPDDEPLFFMCFKLVGNGGSSSAIRITDSELGIEASNPDGDIDINNIILNNGMIDIVAVMPVQNIDDIKTTDLLCNGTSTGDIDIDVSGGVEPLTYSWNNGARTQDLVDVPAGIYKVTITDAQERVIVSDDIQLFEPASLAVSNVQITDFNAEDNIQGAIDISVSGGTGPYTFLWSNGATTEDINGLGAGCYTVVITDRNNCQFTTGDICVEEEITALTALNASARNVICPTDGNGSISFTFNGGTAPFTFSLSNGAMTTSSQRSGSFDNLEIGDYTVIVTDALNANISVVVTVDFTSTFFVEGGVVTTYNGFGVSGAGKMDATITATPNGTVGPYTYEWSDDLGSAAVVSNVGAGTYTVTITDGNGCVATTSITVIAPELLVANATANLMPGCNSICEGEASVNVQGGVAPFSFLWSTGSTQATIFDLCAGDYSVTVTDANSIAISSSLSIIEPDTLGLTFTSMPPSTVTGSDGSVEVFVTGGTAPFTYQWNDSNGSATAAVNGLVPDVYFVIVTDANGCQKVGSVEVTMPIADCFETRTILTIDDDGLNENFIIQCIEQYQNTLTIFNRWGQLVFDVTNYDNTWMGTDRRGEKVPEGGYFFILKVTEATGEITERRGHITIITAE